MGEGVCPVHFQVFLWHTGLCAVTQGQQGWQNAQLLEHPNHFVCQSTREKKLSVLLVSQFGPPGGRRSVQGGQQGLCCLHHSLA